MLTRDIHADHRYSLLSGNVSSTEKPATVFAVNAWERWNPSTFAIQQGEKERSRNLKLCDVKRPCCSRLLCHTCRKLLRVFVSLWVFFVVVLVRSTLSEIFDNSISTLLCIESMYMIPMEL